MKKTAILFASIVLAAGIVGCNNKNKSAKNQGGNLTDVTPPAPTHQPVAYQQQPQQYNTPVTPVNYEPMPEAVTTSTPASGGRTYKVQKGDTLWAIAQKTYGDGKQYRKIVSANPNIKGEKVLAGQMIVLP